MTATPRDISQPVFAPACADYFMAGWPCVIPVPPESKFPPPGGFTGDGGRDTTIEDLVAWAGSQPGASVALRMPDGIIGIDVDQYLKGGKQKHGAETLAAKAAELGPLPATWTSTSRGQGQPSRIHLFRVPPGRYASVLGPDVEIIQRHHRYAVVAPSPHHDDDGAVDGFYAWYAPDGTPLEPGTVPRPDELPRLPGAWVTYLASGAAAATAAAAPPEAGQQLLGTLAMAGDEPACVDMTQAVAAAKAECRSAEHGSRHDTMSGHVFEIVHLGSEGHPGAAVALRDLADEWDSLTSGEGRQAEFGDMVTTAARKAVTKYGVQPAPRDPCLVMNAGAWAQYPAPAPDMNGDLDGEDIAPVEPPRMWTPYSAIGTEPFTPAAGLDAPLASDVLARTWPVLRYAPDAGTWLVRGPETWALRKGNLGAWAVDLLSWLMLRGDPDADEDSEEFRQAKARARFATNASANAIAGKISAQVQAGYHPSALEVAGLDAEREVMWAGGLPYDLRASSGGPAVAPIDPGWPHLQSAGVIPHVRPTPMWDAFTAAVWPDESVRAWVLRVLGIAFTGYSDKALPILLGDTDRGKTEVIKLLMSVLGSYAHVADARLLAPADRSHASIVYALKGRRLSFIDEAPRAGTMAQERLKQITGGADLTANRMQENPITFSPTHTLVLTANPEHEPNLTDAAIARRVRLIPCDGDPAEVRAARAAIGNLDGPAWRREAPGVLAAMMAQAGLWLADPSSGGNDSAPEAGKAAALEIRESQDLVLSWVRDECEPHPEGTRSRELYTAFTESCRRMAIHPAAIPSETAWGRRLNQLGYAMLRREDGRYRPLRVRPPQAFVPTAADFLGTSGGAAGPHVGSTLQEWRVPGEPYSNGDSAGQTVQDPPSTVGSVGSESYYAHTRTRTHAHAGNTNDGYIPAEPVIPTSAQTEPAEPAAGEAGSSDRSEDKPRKVTKPRARKPKVADPELTGPLLPLPALVTPDQRVIPCSVADAEAMTAACGPDLTVDVEHTGFPPGHPDYALRTVQLGNSAVAAVFRADDPEQRAAISRLVAGAQILRAHSAVADLVPLDLDGLAPAEQTWPKMHDTVLAAKLADPALSGSDADGLKDLAGDLLGDAACSPPADKRRAKVFASGGWLGNTDALTPRERSGWAMVDVGWESEIIYAGSDVLDTAAIAKRLPAPPPAVYERERTAQRMCARVSHAGLRLDAGRVRELIARETQAREAARAVITPYGIENPGSAQQVAAALTGLSVYLPRTKPSKKFPQGQPSVAESVLSGIAALGDRAPEASALSAAILDYREHATILSLTLEPFRVLCEHGDGRTRPVIYTINAATGRMSAVRPNLQQIKREGGYRSCIVADDGWVLISADFASVEVRTAAALSQDPDLMAMIANGDACTDHELAKNYDLHWQVTRMVHGPGATKTERYPMKRAVFGHIYGGGAEAMAAGARISLEDAEKVKRSIAALAPRLTAWDAEMREYARKGGREYPAYSGRTIWLPRRQVHAAANYAIQGTAREFLVDALIAWEQTPWGNCTVVPVHDELIVMVRASEAAEATAALTACMESALYGVKIAAEASEPSTYWQDAA